jgi:hypothetical protein
MGLKRVAGTTIRVIAALGIVYLLVLAFCWIGTLGPGHP